MNKKYKIALLLSLLAVVCATQGCGAGVINKLRAKNSLNDGVREYNKGKYEVAEQRFKYAIDLSPDLTNAQLFYARALKAQFDQNLTEDLALKTLKAYDEIIQKNQGNDEAVDQALAFKANLYDQLTRVNSEKAEQYKQLQREILIKRAELPSATNQTKADVYYTLGVGYWKESYDLNASYVSHKQPIPPNVLEKMKPLIQKAHESLRKAISIKPDYANAWFYEKLVYIEDAKVDPAHTAEYSKKALEMQDKYITMQKEQQQAAGAESSATQ